MLLLLLLLCCFETGRDDDSCVTVMLLATTGILVSDIFEDIIVLDADEAVDDCVVVDPFVTRTVGEEVVDDICTVEGPLAASQMM